jgi:hypothetical protein
MTHPATPHGQPVEITLGDPSTDVPLRLLDGKQTELDAWGKAADVFVDPDVMHLVHRNLLIGGEPGAGKSCLINQLVAHAAMSGHSIVVLDRKAIDVTPFLNPKDPS